MGISPLWDFHWYFQRYTLYTFPIGPLVGVFVWKSNSIFINPISRLERQHSTFNSAIKFNLFVHPWTLPNNILGMPNFGVYCIFYLKVFFVQKSQGVMLFYPNSNPYTLFFPTSEEHWMKSATGSEPHRDWKCGIKLFGKELMADIGVGCWDDQGSGFGKELMKETEDR